MNKVEVKNIESKLNYDALKSFQLKCQEELTGKDLVSYIKSIEKK